MIEDFDCGECEENLRNLKPRLLAFHEKLAELAKNVARSESKKKAYKVLSEICGLYFCPNDGDNPLRPLLVLSDNRRSFSIEDLTEEELSFLETIVDSFQSAKLRARIADVLWLRRNKNAHEFAMKAIEAYLEVPLSVDNWKKEGIDDQWTRGSILALKLGKASCTFHGKRIVEHLFDRFSEAPIQEDSYLLFLARLIKLFSVSNEMRLQIAGKLDQSAIFLAGTSQHLSTREMLKSEKRWVDDSTGLQSRIAESFEKEIQSLLPQLDGQHLRVQLLCSQLIEALRVIPEKRRAEYDVENRLEQAQSVLVRCREHTTEDLKLLKSDPIDISETVNKIKTMFRGKSLDVALELFAQFMSQDPKELRDEAEQLIRQFPISNLFQQYTIANDGRIISQTNGFTSCPKTEKEAIDNEKTIDRATMETYLRHVQFAINGLLMPAYSTILNEHYISFSDAVDIVHRSPLIPPDRHLAFARILDFGFHGDFFTAMYILAPEIENVIRFHLKKVGVKTTTIDKNGIEQEVGMSSLMEHPEVAQCIGKNFAWELNALFCCPNGPNLRNNFAHGLETPQLGMSGLPFYAWWLVFRMIMVLRYSEEAPKQEQGIS